MLVESTSDLICKNTIKGKSAVFIILTVHIGLLNLKVLKKLGVAKGGKSVNRSHIIVEK